MGWNSFWLVNHDCVHELRENVNIGKLLDMCPSPKNSDRLAWACNVPSGAIRCEFQADADTQALAIVGNHKIVPLAYEQWSRDQTEESLSLKLLRQAADKLGFRLVRKSTKK